MESAKSLTLQLQNLYSEVLIGAIFRIVRFLKSSHTSARQFHDSAMIGTIRKPQIACHAVFQIFWFQKCVSQGPSVLLLFHFLSTHVTTCDISDLLIQLLHLAHQKLSCPQKQGKNGRKSSLLKQTLFSSFSLTICLSDQTILMHIYCCEHKILVMDLLNTTYFKLHTPDACLKDLGNFFR